MAIHVCARLHLSGVVSTDSQQVAALSGFWSSSTSVHGFPSCTKDRPADPRRDLQSTRRLRCAEAPLIMLMRCPGRTAVILAFLTHMDLHPSPSPPGLVR